MAAISPTSKQLMHELNRSSPLATAVQSIVTAFLSTPLTLLVPDSHNHILLAISLEDFSVRTVAGEPGTADNRNGKPSESRFNMPWVLAVHKPSNLLLVGEFSGSCIRRLADARVTTLCGQPGTYGYAEGAGVNAKFKSVQGLVVVGDTLFVSDTMNHCIRKIPLVLDGETPTETSLFAGQPGCKPGFADSPNPKFHNPCGLTADREGNIYVTEQYNHTLRKITPAGEVSTVAGNFRSRGLQDGACSEARFYYPVDCAWDGNNGVIVADNGNHCLRRVDLPTSTVTTLTGRPEYRSEGRVVDGTLAEARFDRPRGVAVDPSTGVIYVSCDNHTVRRIADGKVTTVFGVPLQSGYGEGKCFHPTLLALM